ncbi:MAG TPA: hemolysin III [Acidobacteria bacterium]|nr:hemolysin III [Acidobacteriota bacterium]
MSETAPAFKVFSPAEERSHAISHGIGILLSIVALAILVTVSLRDGGVRHLIASVVFGATLIILYGTSTLYHSVSDPRLKPVLRMLDHTAIYLLIAGTYTPFTLITLHGPWGWGILTANWILALAGIAHAWSPWRRHRAIAHVLYVLMGWLILIAAVPLSRALQVGGLVLLVLGGVVYTSGLAFYAWRRLPYNHLVWHLFVLTGSALHFFAVLLYVV